MAGTATAGSDYTALAGSVSIPAGAASAPITVTPINDTAVEADETVILTLATNAAYTVGTPNSATVTITSDDVAALPSVSVAATDATAAEAPLGTGTFTVTRTGATTAALTVAYTVAGTATAGSDYTALAGSVSIPAGATSAPITVTPINDTAVEANETVILTLATNAAYTVGTPNSATVTITSDDVAALPSVSVAATDATAAEAPLGTGTFTVTRTGATTAALTVAYTVAGTATAGSDYTALAGSVSIPAGAASAPITVTPINDTAVEANETVILTLATNAAYTVGTPNSATVTITSDDVAALPSVSVAATDATAAEAPLGTGTFTVTRTGATTAALTVAYTVAGTATAGSDYTALAGSVSIPAGAASAPITVTPINDTAVEADETVILTLATNAAYTVGTPNSATVTITSDDVAALPSVSVAATDATAAEAPLGTGTFTVTRTGATTAALTVAYTVAGTATAGSDYTALTGSVSIPAGAASAPITVTPLNDTAVEGPETVILTLATNAAYTVGTPNSATVTITSAVVGNQPPVANAGTPPPPVNVGQPVSLNGNASSDPEGHLLTYRWSFPAGGRPAGSAAVLQNPTAVNPSFVPDVAGTYTVQLVVNDGTQNSTPAAVTIAASVPYLPPVANAGPAQTVTPGGTVALDGSASTVSEGHLLTYRWSFPAGGRPAGSAAALQNPTAVNPSFVPDVAGTYTVQLVVNDGTQNSVNTNNRVTIKAQANLAPTARIVATTLAPNVGQAVGLDGSTSSDPEGQVLSFQWTLVSVPTGSTATLTAGTDSAHTTLTPDMAGSYVVRLTVSDGTQNNINTNNQVTIGALVNLPPVANAGLNQTVTAGATVQLAGSGSSDPEAHALLYSWVFVSKPAGSVAELSSLSAQNPTFVADRAGQYVVGLMVNDSVFNSLLKDNVVITVNAVVTPPPPNAGGVLNISRFRATEEVHVGEQVRFTLWVRNVGTVNGQAPATLVGMRRGVEVYRRTITVSVPVTTTASTFTFPSYTPTARGDIKWTVTIENQSGRVISATETTEVERAERHERSQSED